MKKKTFSNFIRNLSGAMRAFLIVAAVFLVIGLGSAGAVQSTGRAFELPAQQEGDAVTPSVVLHVSAPEDYSGGTLYVKDVYLNVGAIYNEIGSTATLRLGRGTAGTSSFASYTDFVFANGYEAVEEGQTASAIAGGQYNWVSASASSSNWSEAGYSINSYSYYRLVARNANMLINEVVFVGVDHSLAEEEQTPVLLNVSVDENSVLYDSETDSFSGSASLTAAAAILDSQHIPTLAQTSFCRFGEEEVYSLRTISEMYAGGSFYSYNTFTGDRVYSALGSVLLAFGTLIFGISPFGLRFFPMLASFGVLVIGFCLVRRLFKSDRAGLMFALAYALSGVGLVYGHLGTPLMIGVFFLLAALYCAVLFLLNGMKGANVRSVMPVALSALFSAAAICVNGAFVVPVLGVVAVFIAGMVRQMRARRYHLDKAIAEAEQSEDEGGKEQVAKVVSEYRYKNRTAVGCFAVLLIFGAFFLSLLGTLPMFFTYAKLYTDLAGGASSNFFLLMWNAFAGGFVGSNPVSASQSVWSIWYETFRGAGDMYAVTATGLFAALPAVLIGVVGMVLALIRIVRYFRGGREKSERAFVRAAAILFGGLVLSLIAALFAQGGPVMIMLAYVFVFAFVGLAAAGRGEARSNGEKAVTAVAITVAAIVFLLAAVFTFSIPLAASFMGMF